MPSSRPDTDPAVREGGRAPTKGRGARSTRLRRVAVGGAAPEEQHRRRGDRIVATVDALVDQLAVMRGAAMKAGQVLSTVEFLSLDADQSAHLQARLASLRDDVPAVDYSQMRHILQAEWGWAPERVRAEIDPEPAAAASIGQVYRATAKDGRRLAIKVQYPGIAETVESDMRNLRLLSPLLRQLMPGLEVRAVLEELRERIVEEYELEAANHRRVERFWRGHPFVRVPAVDTELSHRRVLVSEWIDGDGFDAISAATCRRDTAPRHGRSTQRRCAQPCVVSAGSLPTPHRRRSRTPSARWMADSPRNW